MNEFWITVADQEINNEQSSFQYWTGLNVWIERPHLLNRKLLGYEIVHTISIPQSRLEHIADYDEKSQFYMKDVFDSQDLTTCFTAESDSIKGLGVKCDVQYFVSFRKLIPRNLCKFSEVLEAVIKDEKNNTVTFWPKKSDVDKSAITPSFPYRIKLQGNRICIKSYEKNMKHIIAEQASKEWLRVSVLPKIIKWCCNSPTTAVIQSLNLVSIKLYSMNYNYLKDKYGKKYVEIWPECSDPLKYVYEDIAIAAYLMTLWEEERRILNLLSKQTFVDLGCGNGLLVNILSSEGYVGIGIDVRKRKIWDLYEDNTVLLEKVIEPSDYHIFPDYDWIIGNHSDELTPWIPVIAARSSYRMRVFLLPCCAYSFNGKYGRSCQDKTQYQAYLSFIHSLCECMGFNVKEDKLRIPSTKRICLVCTSRNYSEGDEINIDIRRKDFIENHSRKTEDTSFTNRESAGNSKVNQANGLDNSSLLKTVNWIPNFKPREKVELVQNCSQLDRKFLENTVLIVANLLLKTENYISLQKGEETILWNSGGKIQFSDLIKLLDPSILKCMKNQCGGFQSFIRNHRNVFQIIDGEVQLSVPVKGIPLNSKVTGKKRSRKKQYNFQEKPCFFFHHHPQGCPLEDCDCNFSHKILELQNT